jgi:hypothetical protein
MYTAYALVRNLSRAAGEPNAARAELRFRDFRIWNVPQFEGPNGERFKEARQIFPYARVSFGDWVYEKDYSSLPTARGPAPSGLGGIPEDTEDSLLLLRLFKSGDISFAQVSVRDANRSLSSQYPYRVTSDIPSVFPYKLSQGQCREWDVFADEVKTRPGWRSSWFMVARRYFLYGGAKEFNCYAERQSGIEINEVDRVVDYMIGLEAALVAERDFVGRRLRERATRLVCKDPGESEATKKLLRELYDVRSTIAHGSPLTDEQRDFLQRRREDFEGVVRKILVESLRSLPAEDERRKAALSNLWDISDRDRAQKLFEDFGKIKKQQEKSLLLQRLSKRGSQ